jgi:hypothetical protein
MAVGTAAGAYVLIRSVNLSLLAGSVVLGAAVLSQGLTTALAGSAVALWVLRCALTAASDGADGADGVAWVAVARSQARFVGIPALLAAAICQMLTQGEVISVIAAALGAVVVGVYVLAVLPLALGRIALDEAAIAHANRAGEVLERLAARLDFLEQARWALSLSGIAMVLLVLILFDPVATKMWTMRPFAGSGAAVAVFAIGWGWLRSWRIALAAAASAGFAATLATWAAAHAGASAPWALITSGTGVVAALAFVLAAGLAESGASAALSARTGTVLCAVLAWLIAAVAQPFAAALALAAALTCVLLLPAFFVALGTMLPRYRSLEDVFGRK